jgi:hypothetical protein
MNSEKKPADPDRKLVNDLTVEDARHLLGNEGGRLSWDELVVRVVTELTVAAMLAYAIWRGNVTAWHLALPSLAQYLTLLLVLPPIYLVFRHPDLRKDVMGAVRLNLGIAALVAAATAARTWHSQIGWTDQLASDAELAWNWIADAGVQWPILIAAVGAVLALPGRVRNLYKFGPPFVGVSLGCAMRLVVLLLGCFLLPMAMSDSTRMVWFLWAVLLLAEGLALGMHWDIQRRLQKVDGAAEHNA